MQKRKVRLQNFLLTVLAVTFVVSGTTTTCLDPGDDSTTVYAIDSKLYPLNVNISDTSYGYMATPNLGYTEADHYMNAQSLQYNAKNQFSRKLDTSSAQSDFYVYKSNEAIISLTGGLNLSGYVVTQDVPLRLFQFQYPSLNGQPGGTGYFSDLIPLQVFTPNNTQMNFMVASKAETVPIVNGVKLTNGLGFFAAMAPASSQTAGKYSDYTKWLCHTGVPMRNACGLGLIGSSSPLARACDNTGGCADSIDWENDHAKDPLSNKFSWISGYYPWPVLLDSDGHGLTKAYTNSDPLVAGSIPKDDGTNLRQLTSLLGFTKVYEYAKDQVRDSYGGQVTTGIYGINVNSGGGTNDKDRHSPSWNCVYNDHYAGNRGPCTTYYQIPWANLKNFVYCTHDYTLAKWATNNRSFTDATPQVAQMDTAGPMTRWYFEGSGATCSSVDAEYDITNTLGMFGGPYSYTIAGSNIFWGLKSDSVYVDCDTWSGGTASCKEVRSSSSTNTNQTTCFNRGPYRMVWPIQGVLVGMPLSSKSNIKMPGLDGYDDWTKFDKSHNDFDFSKPGKCAISLTISGSSSSTLTHTFGYDDLEADWYTFPTLAKAGDRIQFSMNENATFYGGRISLLTNSGTVVTDIPSGSATVWEWNGTPSAADIFSQHAGVKYCHAATFYAIRPLTFVGCFSHYENGCTNLRVANATDCCPTDVSSGGTCTIDVGNSKIAVGACVKIISKANGVQTKKPQAYGDPSNMLINTFVDAGQVFSTSENVRSDQCGVCVTSGLDTDGNTGLPMVTSSNDYINATSTINDSGSCVSNGNSWYTAIYDDLNEKAPVTYQFTTNGVRSFCKDDESTMQTGPDGNVQSLVSFNNGFSFNGVLFGNLFGNMGTSASVTVNTPSSGDYTTVMGYAGNGNSLGTLFTKADYDANLLYKQGDWVPPNGCKCDSDGKNCTTSDASVLKSITDSGLSDPCKDLVSTKASDNVWRSNSVTVTSGITAKNGQNVYIYIQEFEKKADGTYSTTLDATKAPSVVFKGMSHDEIFRQLANHPSTMFSFISLCQASGNSNTVAHFIPPVSGKLWFLILDTNPASGVDARNSVSDGRTLTFTTETPKSPPPVITASNLLYYNTGNLQVSAKTKTPASGGSGQFISQAKTYIIDETIVRLFFGNLIQDPASCKNYLQKTSTDAQPSQGGTTNDPLPATPPPPVPVTTDPPCNSDGTYQSTVNMPSNPGTPMCVSCARLGIMQANGYPSPVSSTNVPPGCTASSDSNFVCDNNFVTACSAGGAPPTYISIGSDNDLINVCQNQASSVLPTNSKLQFYQCQNATPAVQGVPPTTGAPGFVAVTGPVPIPPIGQAQRCYTDVSLAGRGTFTPYSGYGAGTIDDGRVMELVNPTLSCSGSRTVTTSSSGSNIEIITLNGVTYNRYDTGASDLRTINAPSGCTFTGGVARMWYYRAPGTACPSTFPGNGSNLSSVDGGIVQFPLGSSNKVTASNFATACLNMEIGDPGLCFSYYDALSKGWYAATALKNAFSSTAGDATKLNVKSPALQVRKCMQPAIQINNNSGGGFSCISKIRNQSLNDGGATTDVSAVFSEKVFLPARTPDGSALDTRVLRINSLNMQFQGPGQYPSGNAYHIGSSSTVVYGNSAAFSVTNANWGNYAGSTNYADSTSCRGWWGGGNGIGLQSTAAGCGNTSMGSRSCSSATVTDPNSPIIYPSYFAGGAGAYNLAIVDSFNGCNNCGSRCGGIPTGSPTCQLYPIVANVNVIYYTNWLSSCNSGDTDLGLVLNPYANDVPFKLGYDTAVTNVSDSNWAKIKSTYDNLSQVDARTNAIPATKMCVNFYYLNSANASATYAPSGGSSWLCVSGANRDAQVSGLGGCNVNPVGPTNIPLLLQKGTNNAPWTTRMTNWYNYSYTSTDITNTSQGRGWCHLSGISTYFQINQQMLNDCISRCYSSTPSGTSIVQFSSADAIFNQYNLDGSSVSGNLLVNASQINHRYAFQGINPINTVLWTPDYTKSTCPVAVAGVPYSFPILSTLVEYVFVPPSSNCPAPLADPQGKIVVDHSISRIIWNPADCEADSTKCQEEVQKVAFHPTKGNSNYDTGMVGASSQLNNLVTPVQNAIRATYGSVATVDQPAIAEILPTTPVFPVPASPAMCALSSLNKDGSIVQLGVAKVLIAKKYGDCQAKCITAGVVDIAQCPVNGRVKNCAVYVFDPYQTSKTISQCIGSPYTDTTCWNSNDPSGAAWSAADIATGRNRNATFAYPYDQIQNNDWTDDSTVPPCATTVENIKLFKSYSSCTPKTELSDPADLSSAQFAYQTCTITRECVPNASGNGTMQVVSQNQRVPVTIVPTSVDGSDGGYNGVGSDGTSTIGVKNCTPVYVDRVDYLSCTSNNAKICRQVTTMNCINTNRPIIKGVVLASSTPPSDQSYACHFPDNNRFYCTTKLYNAVLNGGDVNVTKSTGGDEITICDINSIAAQEQTEISTSASSAVKMGYASTESMKIDHYICTVSNKCTYVPPPSNTDIDTSLPPGSITTTTPPPGYKIVTVCSQSYDWDGGLTKLINMAFMGSAPLQILVWLSVIAVITIKGSKIVLGEEKIDMSNILKEVITISVTLMVVYPGSWPFVQNMIMQPTLNLIDGLNMMAVQALNPGAVDIKSAFYPLDNFFVVTFDSIQIARDTAPMFSSFQGFILTCCIFYAIIQFILLIGKCFVMYASSMIMLGLYSCLVVPIMMFFCYQKTRSYATNLIKGIVGVAWGQFTMFCTIAIVTQLFEGVIAGVTDYKICKVPIISFFGINVFSWWSIAGQIPTSIKPYFPAAAALDGGYSGGPTIQSIILVLVTSGICEKMITQPIWGGDASLQTMFKGLASALDKARGGVRSFGGKAAMLPYKAGNALLGRGAQLAGKGASAIGSKMKGKSGGGGSDGGNDSGDSRGVPKGSDNAGGGGATPAPSIGGGNPSSGGDSTLRGAIGKATNVPTGEGGVAKSDPSPKGSDNAGGGGATPAPSIGGGNPSSGGDSTLRSVPPSGGGGATPGGDSTLRSVPPSGGGGATPGGDSTLRSVPPSGGGGQNNLPSGQTQSPAAKRIVLEEKIKQMKDNGKAVYINKTPSPKTSDEISTKVSEDSSDGNKREIQVQKQSINRPKGNNGNKANLTNAKKDRQAEAYRKHIARIRDGKK